MLVASVILLGIVALKRMPQDVFPDLGVPTIYVAQPYGGMDPAQMEGFLTNYYEYHFLYVNGIEHVESRNIQGVALIKLQFHPGTDMSRAMAETVAYVNRSRAFMPPGTIPPFITRFDAGSVPVGNLVFYSDDPNVSIKDLQDAGLFKVRPLFSTLPGVSAPPPFGGAPRALVVRADPDKLRAYNMSPDEVVAAVTKGSIISPSGNVRIGDTMPMVPVSSIAPGPTDLGAIPIRANGTQSIFVRDIGTVEDSSDTATGYAMVNGRRTVYIPVTKRADASTMTVVNTVKANLPNFQAVLPPNVKVSYEFDQSPYVTRAIHGLGIEGMIGAVLTGLMVLLFLRDWRSAVVVVVNIPIAITAALVALWLSGQTVNIMTLGGLALAVGVLVDEATVTIENVHTHLARGQSLARAAYDATTETQVPRLLAMLCILAVFIPALFMTGAARSLFIPLALAVGLAMIASYILSSTLVPVLSIWLLRSQKHEDQVHDNRAFDRVRTRYAGLIGGMVKARWAVLLIYLVVTIGMVIVLYPKLGREIFPQVDVGQFTLRIHAPAGTRIEKTEQLAQQTLQTIEEEVGKENVAISMAFIGVQHGAYPVNTIHLWTSGPEEAVMQVQLKPGVVRLDAFKEKLRQRFAKDFPDARFGFEPSDIVNRVMSFGSPTPVQVAVSGADLAVTRQTATKLKEEMAKISSLRDLQFEQALEYPAIKVDPDREKAAMFGVTVEQIARSLTGATSSSRYTAANYWADPKTGVAYQVQVMVPEQRMDSIEQVRNVPVATRDGQSVLLRQVANVKEGEVLGEYDRYNMQRQLTLNASIAGEDLGSVSKELDRAVASLGELPPKTKVAIRGQIAPMNELFSGLETGLSVAVLVILLMLSANFQSFRLSIAVLLTIPAVLAGVMVALIITGTTLNIQSFMGAIMAMGVAVANSILLVTFAEKTRIDGHRVVDAAVMGAASRLRPILMTSFAMIAGMAPMAIGSGAGSEQTAPLGRAVIGGLVAATLATLFILPSGFAMLQRDRARRKLSLFPEEQPLELRAAAPADRPGADAFEPANGEAQNEIVRALDSSDEVVKHEDSM